jgi:hypothetical protein
MPTHKHPRKKRRSWVRELKTTTVARSLPDDRKRTLKRAMALVRRHG